jgi:hypothetical protein
MLRIVHYCFSFSGNLARVLAFGHRARGEAAVGWDDFGNFGKIRGFSQVWTGNSFCQQKAAWIKEHCGKC